MLLNKLLKVSNKVIDKYKQYNSINSIVNSQPVSKKVTNSIFGEQIEHLNSAKVTKPKIQLDEVKLKKYANKSLTPFQKSYMDSKYKCIEALNSAQPRELAFLLDSKSGKVVGEFAGDAKSCVINGKINGDEVVLLHGHPAIRGSSKTLPVSLQDFIVLNDNSKLKQIIAFDKKGHKYSLTKLQDYQKLSNMEMKELKDSYLRFLLDNSSKNDTKTIRDLVAYCKANPNNCDSIKGKVAEEVTKLQYKESAADLINEFWKNNAKSLNLEYYSGI